MSFDLTFFCCERLRVINHTPCGVLFSWILLDDFGAPMTVAVPGGSSVYQTFFTLVCS